MSIFKTCAIFILTLQHKIQTARVIQNSEFYIIGLTQIYLFRLLEFFFFVQHFITIDKLWSANPDIPPYQRKTTCTLYKRIILRIRTKVRHIRRPWIFQTYFKIMKNNLQPLPTNKIYYLSDPIPWGNLGSMHAH